MKSSLIAVAVLAPIVTGQDRPLTPPPPPLVARLASCATGNYEYPTAPNNLWYSGTAIDAFVGTPVNCDAVAFHSRCELGCLLYPFSMQDCDGVERYGAFPSVSVTGDRVGAHDVSADGLCVVGSAASMIFCVRVPARAWIWTPGTLRDLGAEYGLLPSTAEAVTDDGRYVIGRCPLFPSGVFVVDGSGARRDLGDIVQMPIYEAWIARGGVVLFTTQQNGGFREVYRWRPTAGVENWGTISAAANIYRWSRGGGACLAGGAVCLRTGQQIPLPSALEPFDISEDGSVVVGILAGDAGSPDAGAIWTQAAGLRRMSEVLKTLLYRSTASLQPDWWTTYGPVEWRRSIMDVQLVAGNGALLAGRYTNYIDWDFVDRWAISGLDLSPHCRADVNMDGNLDPDDLGDFINAYFSNPPQSAAHWSGEGPPDPDDLGDFINAYFAGCP